MVFSNSKSLVENVIDTRTVTCDVILNTNIDGAWAEYGAGDQRTIDIVNELNESGYVYSLFNNQFLWTPSLDGKLEAYRCDDYYVELLEIGYDEELGRCTAVVKAKHLSDICKTFLLKRTFDIGVFINEYNKHEGCVDAVREVNVLYGTMDEFANFINHIHENAETTLDSSI